MKSVQATPYTLRPPQHQREMLEQIAAELGKSETQVIFGFINDALEMLERGKLDVPPSVKMIQVLRDNRATLRDRREVTFYQDDSVQAGTSTGICCDNPPNTLIVSRDIRERVDFAVRICGDSMTPVVEEGEGALFRRTVEAANGKVIAAMVDGQMMLKAFEQLPSGSAQLKSFNKAYPPIPCDEDTQIQGVFVGKLSAAEVHE